MFRYFTLLIVKRFIHQLHTSLQQPWSQFLSPLRPLSKSGKGERNRESGIKVEPLARIWRAPSAHVLTLINWLIYWLIDCLFDLYHYIMFSMSLRALHKRSEQLTSHFAELMLYSVNARCNYIFLWNIVFYNALLDTSSHIYPQDTSDRTSPLPWYTP